MKIEVFFSPAGVDELGMRGRNVIIIDVLRATTTICTALRNGAREVIPTPDLESATKISSNLSGDSRLLGGERQGKKIDGFDLGNSPAEYTPEKVAGKSIIFTTTNGAGAIYKCRYASTALVAGFVNMSAIVQTIVEIGGTWTLLCSGRSGAFSIEDATCAGMIISKVKEQTEVDTEDAGLTALILYKNYKKSVLGMMKKSLHGMYLASIGFEDDLKLCSEVDSVPVVPAVSGLVVRIRQAASEALPKTGEAT